MSQGFLTFAKMLGLFQDSGDIQITNTDSAGFLNIRVGSGTTIKIKTIELATPSNTKTLALTRAVPLSGTVSMFAFVTAKRVGANADGVVSFAYNACTNNAGTVAAVGTSGGATVENSAGTPAVAIEANDTTDAIELNVTGIASQPYNWKGVVVLIETL